MNCIEFGVKILELLELLLVKILRSALSICIWLAKQLFVVATDILVSVRWDSSNDQFACWVYENWRHGLVVGLDRFRSILCIASHDMRHAVCHHWGQYVSTWLLSGLYYCIV